MSALTLHIVIDNDTCRSHLARAARMTLFSP